MNKSPLPDLLASGRKSITFDNSPIPSPDRTFQQRHPNPSKSTPMDIDDVLGKIKPFGRYQILLTLLYMYAMFPLNVNNYFMGYDDSNPQFLCSDDPASNASTIPTRDCQVYYDCSPKNLTFVVPFYSVSHEFGLICSRSYYVNLITTIQMAGDLCGALFIGLISDAYGRKLTFILVMTTQILVGCVSALSPNWAAFTVFRFLIGCCAGAEMVAGWVLVAEWTTNRYRYLIRVLAAATLANLDPPLLAYLTGNWKWFSVVGNLQGLPLLILLVFFTEESPRWLLHKGRAAEALYLLRRIAKFNRTEHLLPEEITLEVQHPEAGTVVPQTVGDLEAPKTTTTTVDDPQAKPVVIRPWHLFATRQLATYTVVCVASWFLVSMVYYGMFFNTSYLPANIYLSMTILGLVNMLEVPLAIYDAYNPNMNRRWLLLIGLSCSVVILGSIMVLLGVDAASQIAGYDIAVAIINVLGQLAITIVFDLSYMYAVELFPTLLRSTAGALCSVGARVGAMIAPQVIYAHTLWPAAPYAFFAGFGLVCLVISWVFLPNTKQMHLPDSEKRRDSNGSKY